MPKLRIANFQGVSSRKDGTLEEALKGHASEAFNVDPYQREGGLISALGAGDFSITGTPEILNEIIKGPGPSGEYWGISDGGLWKETANVWAKVATSTGSSTVGSHGIAYYKDFIYYTSGTTTIGRFGPISGAPVVDNSFQTLSDGTSSRMIVKNDILWIAKSNFGAINPSLSSWDNSTFAEDDILFDPLGGTIGALGESRELLLTAIGSTLIAWDGNDEGSNFTMEFDDDILAIAYAENVSYIVTAKSVYSFTQDGGVRHLFEIPDRLRGGTETSSMSILQASPFNKLIIFGTHATIETLDMSFSVWAFPRIQYVKNPMPFEYYREAIVATPNTVGVYGVYGDSDRIIFSRVDASSVIHISTINTSPDRSSGEWASQYLDFGFPDFDKDITSIEVVHDALGADDSVEVEFAVDQSDSFSSKLLSETDGDVSKSVGLNGIRGRKISVKLKTERDALVRDLIIGYRVLPKTI